MNRGIEIAEKTVRLQKMLATEGLGGVLLGAQHNFSWLTGGATSGIDQSREPGAGALLVRADGRRFVLASRIEMARLLEEELGGADFEPVEFSWEEEKAVPNFLAGRARALLEGGAPVGSDLPLGAEAKVVEGAVARCRYQLLPPELERFRKLGSDAGRIVGELVRELEPGASENEIARCTSDALAAEGIRAVVNLVAADERIGKYRHPIPTGRRWERVLMVVVCARRGGLIASLSRIVCVGALPEELKRRTLACARVNARLLAATRPGATGAEIYHEAARAYAEAGFEGEERLHHQGGAAGYRTRDWVAHPASSEVVHASQAFAWNPSITGTKTEETCIVSEGGIKMMTASPGWPQIAVELEGREYLLPDVLCV